MPIIMEKARRDKRKEVQTRLNFGENPKKTRKERENSLNSRAENSPTRFHPGISWTCGHEKRDDRNVPSRTDSRDPSHSRGHSLSREHPRVKDRFRGVEESYGDTYSRGTRTKYRDRSRDDDRFRGFDELPPESIEGYKGPKAAFLAYFMQQKKYVKDPVEIHNIKQRDGKTIEDFMERFKVKTGRMKGAP
ncbi:hypothetical protein Tco_0783534, partial [Tanacetum coccineum]